MVKNKFKRQEDQLQNKQTPLAIQEQIGTFTGSDQKKRTREVICTFQSGTCFCCRKRTAGLSQDPIQRATKATGKTEYDVCSREHHHSRQAWIHGCLIPHILMWI